MMQGKKKFLPLRSSDICRIYGLLYKHRIVAFPLTSEAFNKLDALVHNINGIYFETEIYKTPEEKVIAYLYFLTKDHAFTDGNKRTACLVFEVLCELNGLHPELNDFELDALAVFIERISGIDHQRVIRDISSLIFPS